MRPDNPICWFEVEDFLDYVRQHPSPSGIQRVQREILTQVERHYAPRGRASYCRLNRVTHEFEPVDLSFLWDATTDWRQKCEQSASELYDLPSLPQIARLARRYLKLPGAARTAAQTMGQARQLGAVPRRHRVPFAAGDVLVSLGGEWHDRYYTEVVGLLRREQRVRSAVLLHDIIPVTHPEWVPPTLSEAVHRWVPEMLAIADVVFTPSDYARRELLAYSGPSRVHLPPVTVLRFGTGFRKWNPAASADRLSNRLPERFALFVSTIEIRKNHQLLIEVWQRLIEKYGKDTVPHLVFVGRLGWGSDDVVRRLEGRTNLDGKVVIISDLSDGELEEAYRACHITVFPSLSEGWGLPVAESLKHGKLCIAADRASIPEVGGDLVDYFDPDDIEDALHKIERALFDSDYLAMRENRIESEFISSSWETCTHDLMRELQRLSEQPIATRVAPGAPRVNEVSTALRILTEPLRSSVRRRIIVLKLDHLGDMIIAVPALTKLRNEFPNDEITLVCGSWNKTLAERLNIFDCIFTHDYQPRNARIQNTPPPESMNHFESLLTGTYDIAIDLKVDADTRVFLTRVDASMRCGFATADRFPYLDVALPLTAGRVALAEDSPPKHVFGPEEFFSRLPANALFLETDFTLTNLCVVYGPYATLPKGNYLARFYFTAIGLDSQNLASEIMFDVARNETRLASRHLGKLTGRAELMSGTVVIPFSNDDAEGLFEFRLSTKGRPYTGSLRFFGVTVESTSFGDQASRRRLRKLHVGELCSLLVQLIAERSRAVKLLPQTVRRAPMNAVREADLKMFLDQSDPILIAPFSNKATRDWPLSYYSRLVGIILSKLRNHIGLLGASEHLDSLNQIVRENSSSARLHNLAGKIEWSELPRVFDNASVVISNNSGIAHYAAACGAPLIAIYSGAVLVEEWAPRGENTVVTVTADVPCSPCGYDKLEHCNYEHRCMTLISAESVFGEVSKLLRETPHRARGAYGSPRKE